MPDGVRARSPEREESVKVKCFGCAALIEASDADADVMRRRVDSVPR
jgi:hypothetical protein